MLLEHIIVRNVTRLNNKIISLQVYIFIGIAVLSFINRECIWRKKHLFIVLFENDYVVEYKVWCYVWCMCMFSQICDI